MREKAIQLSIRRFMQSMGFAVWDLSQPRATMQTAGMPDLIAAGKGRILFIEVKTARGTQTPAQIVFQKEIEANGGTYLLWRSTKDAWDFLVSAGIIEGGR